MPDVGVMDNRAIGLTSELHEQYDAIRLLEIDLAEALGEVVLIDKGQAGSEDQRRRLVLLRQMPGPLAFEMLAELEAMKARYLAELKALELATREDEDRDVGPFPEIGDRAMAPPILVNRAGKQPLLSAEAAELIGAALADRAIRLSHATRQAWRVGEYTVAELRRHFSTLRANKLRALENAEKQHKRTRVIEIEAGLAEIAATEAGLARAVSGLTDRGKRAILRVKSGTGDDFRASWDAKSVGFGIRSLALVAVADGAQLVRAQTRKRISTLELVDVIDRYGVFTHRN